LETELNRIINALPGLVWTALPSGSIDFLSQRWFEYTGRDAEENYGWGWQTATHPEGRSDLLERWRSILASREPGEMEARLRRFDGEYRWFLFRMCPLADASGEIVKWCGTSTDIEDRKRKEDDLRSHAEQLNSIVDSVPALVTVMTPAGEIENVNRQLLEYFDATLEQLKGRTTTEKSARGSSIHPDDAFGAFSAWKHALETGEPFDAESRIRRADGVYRWFQTRAVPFKDTEGRVVRWYNLLTDIDDRKRAEALLADQKRFLEMVAGGHSMSVILESLCRLIEDATGGSYCSVVLVDPSCTRLEHGAAPSLPADFINSIIGRPVNIDSGPCAMAAYLNERVIAPDLTRETRWATYQWCSKALAHGLRACWSTPITSAAGKVLGAFAIYYDEPKMPTAQHQALIDQFTHVASIAVERAQSDAALKQSEAFLAEAQRLSRTGSFRWRAATGEITWSDEAYRIYELDEAVPMTFERCATRFFPEDAPTLNELIAKARHDETDFEFEHRLQSKDGSVKYLHVVAHGSRDQNGQLEYFGAIQDITERRLSEDALAKVRAELTHVSRVTALGELTASIAHEVNQPLSGVITNASTCLRMLGDDPPNVDGARETARRMIRDSHRASDVITRLRSLFAKKDASSEFVDLNEATREVLALSRHELQRNRVTVRTEFADNLPPVEGDRVQLQQVVLNLILNASDAMSGVDDRPRRLLIRTERSEDDRVRLTAQDAGVGVEPQSVNTIFDAFYTTKNGGMGIGLSVSRSIIERHHGRLWAEPNDGPGATFTFSIPRRAKDVSIDRGLGSVLVAPANVAAHVASAS
jgi:PAS domain S-box-containing protein